MNPQDLPLLSRDLSTEEFRRINHLAEGALDLEPGMRAAFLDDACAGDFELRRHVEQILASAECMGSFLEEPEDHLAACASLEISTGLDRDRRIGQRIGPYQLNREIGRGGMGTVYLVHRADGEYRRQAAIKLINIGLSMEAAVKRFRNERQVLASLQHPNIAMLLDGGTTEEGLPYLVMEYVHGLPINVWCDERKLPLNERLTLFIGVCSAVQYAHDKQVIHRDIKPSNVLVTVDGTPKLLDFGIAKVLDPELYAQTMETTAGAGLMTPLYASPEQARGDPVGPASDVYSLGVLLYRLVTGRLPYRLEGRDPAEILRVICSQQPTKPSEAIMAEVSGSTDVPAAIPATARDVPSPDLDNVILMALQKDPGLRYASVTDLADDLQHVLVGLPVRARKETVGRRAARLLRRNRVATGVAALSSVAAVALGIGVASWRTLHEPGAGRAVQSIAVLPLENVSGTPQDEQLADGLTGALSGELAKIGSLRVISHTSTARFKGADKSASLAARDLRVNAVVDGSVLRTANHVRFSVRLFAGSMDRVQWTQSYDRDIADVSALQGEVARAIAREVRVTLTSQEEARLGKNGSVNRQAYEAYLKGRYYVLKYTKDGFQKGIQSFHEAVEIDPGYALAWAGLAHGYFEMSGMMDPHQAIPMVRAAATRALAIDENLAEAHDILATVDAQYERNWTAAERGFRRAIELNPSDADARRHYSMYLAEHGLIEPALSQMAEAYRLDPLPPMTATNLGWFYYLARRTDQAIAHFRKILEFNPSLPATHYSLALAYEQKGMFEPAIAEALKARSMEGNGNGCLGYLGHIYASTGKTGEARRVIEELKEQSKTRYVDSADIGRIYLGLGDRDSAFRWFEKAYEERSEQLLYVKLDPHFDPIRADPRFRKLLERLGLPL